ncbi:hypothetical protein DY000_02032774 [Brassica cretica]|uniref:40S ribosomal protein S21 n=1 Tax=Brassica cretica TaxID=69181 RepID=A0ABQ7DQJ1_BRACR|nr:hypothetical protein DY000_02032774 [Brassica cretica]
MQNEEGVVTELYIPRKCSATNRLITSKDHASVQLNIGHLDADGIYTGQFTTLALCGFVRAQGDADSGVDRLWQKKKVETKQLKLRLPDYPLISANEKLIMTVPFFNRTGQCILK